MDTDTAIYAAIAIILLGKLWSVLGRHKSGDKGSDPKNFDLARFNPFASKDPDNHIGKSAAKNNGQDDDTGPYHPPVRTGANILPGQGSAPGATVGKLNGNLLPGLRVFFHAPDSLAGGLEQIRGLDPNFDEKQFLQVARNQFSAILEDFSRGDLLKTKPLLGPTVYPHFQNAISARNAAGQRLDSKLERIRDTELTMARVVGSQAFITVHFISEQKNALRASIDAPSTDIPTEEISDVWVFTRDFKSTNSDWVVVETRS